MTLLCTIEVYTDGKTTTAILKRSARRSERALEANALRTLYTLTDLIESGETPGMPYSGVGFIERKQAALELCDRNGLVNVATFSAHQRIERRYAASILRRIARLGSIVPLMRTGHVVPQHYVRADQPLPERLAEGG